MSADLETPSYRISVRRRALPPSPYKWEIYRNDEQLPYRTATESFKSEEAARSAAQGVVDRLLDEHARQRERAAKPPKRPRDANQLAKAIVDIATDQTDAPAISMTVKRARAGGESGGPARAKLLTPQQRSEIASIAAQARWKKS